MSELETGATYERKDMDARAVTWFAVGLVAMLLLTFVVVKMFLSFLAGDLPIGNSHALTPRQDVPPPRLQTDAAAELAELRASEEATLHSYGWVDREGGVIRIPIERAMELTLERGLPARSDTKGGDR